MRITKNIISLRNITKIYNGANGIVTALDSVNVDINSGELICITGSSGSGKSTLINILGLLDTATHGEYELCNQPVQNLSERKLSKLRRENIGFVFQSFNLIPTLTAEANTELSLKYRHIPKAERKIRTQAALEAVGLKDRMHHLPHQLSGGQQQRVAIARAIAAKPNIILADEPTGNLDPKSAEQIMSLLMRQAPKHTVILITHDQKIADRFPRRIRIEQGKIT